MDLAIRLADSDCYQPVRIVVIDSQTMERKMEMDKMKQADYLDWSMATYYQTRYEVTMRDARKIPIVSYHDDYDSMAKRVQYAMDTNPLADVEVTVVTTEHYVMRHPNRRDDE